MNVHLHNQKADQTAVLEMKNSQRITVAIVLGMLVQIIDWVQSVSIVASV